MPGPRFSVVIPTRDRAETLAFTLKTCLDQDFNDYEVVVCDQGSGTVEGLVGRCASGRVRYVRTPTTGSVVDNWNLAVAEARGEYVMVLGSDDGLMPYALRELDRLIGQTRSRLFTWPPPVLYIWPAAACPEEANYLVVPMDRHITQFQSRERIAALLHNEACMGTMPTIYHGLAHRSLLDELRQRTGTVFATPFQDSYAAIALAYLAGSYTSVSVPMTVSAFSATSFGAVFFAAKTRSPVYQEGMQAYARAGLHHHPWVPKLPLMSVIMANSFLAAKEALFPNDQKLVLDRKRMARLYVSQLWTDDVTERQELLGMIRDSLSDSPQLVAWFDSTDPMRVPSVRPFRYRDWGLGFNGRLLCLNGDEFGISDVAGAVTFATRLLGYRAGKIRYDLPSRESERWLAGLLRKTGLRRLLGRLPRKLLDVFRRTNRRAAA